MTTIVALFGPAGCGKSTAAGILRDRWGARVYAFADPLKDLVRDAFELTEAQVRGTQAEKEAVDPRYGVSARWLMQGVGTDGIEYAGADMFEFWENLDQDTQTRCQLLGRALLNTCDAMFVEECFRHGFRETAGRDVWIRACLARITADAPRLAVIQDGRFPNEAEACRPGYAWRLLPPPDMERASTDAGTHASETGWQDAACDWVVHPRRAGVEYLTASLAEALDACKIYP